MANRISGPLAHNVPRYYLCMRRLVSCHIQHGEAALKDCQRMSTSSLGKTDEALVAKFRKLIQAWESDKADSVGSMVDHVIDPETGPSESLESLSSSTVASSPGPDLTKADQYLRILGCALVFGTKVDI